MLHAVKKLPREVVMTEVQTTPAALFFVSLNNGVRLRRALLYNAWLCGVAGLGALKNVA